MQASSTPALRYGPRWTTPSSRSSAGTRSGTGYGSLASSRINQPPVVPTDGVVAGEQALDLPCLEDKGVQLALGLPHPHLGYLLEEPPHLAPAVPPLKYVRTLALRSLAFPT